MAILGITNRTENWKTARYFAPLLGSASVRLARRLVGRSAPLEPGDVRLELFWKGMRDLIARGEHGDREQRAALLARHYQDAFPTLRKQVSGFGEFRALQDWNYCAETPEERTRLESNLRNTEVDIVLESPGRLFIGEAKHEMSFGTASRDVLTHQLIRQYVTARILLKLLGRDDEIVPFVVADDRPDVMKRKQVRFMLAQGWMRPDNVLEWSDIEALW